MSSTVRAGIAAFDAVAMAVYAYLATGGFGNLGTDLILWGSAAAAALAAFLVSTNGPAALGWIAIGYILFAGILLAGPELVLITLAFALMPVVQRPRGSLALGISIAVVAAFAWLFVVMIVLRGA
ncbi:MAG TPA: hypothetical protein VIM50_01690 [Candidatus Limnocylindria bacterium]